MLFLLVRMSSSLFVFIYLSLYLFFILHFCVLFFISGVSVCHFFSSQQFLTTCSIAYFCLLQQSDGLPVGEQFCIIIAYITLVEPFFSLLYLCLSVFYIFNYLLVYTFMFLFSSFFVFAFIYSCVIFFCCYSMESSFSVGCFYLPTSVFLCSYGPTVFFLMFSLYGSNFVLIYSWMSIFCIFIYSSISIFIHGFLLSSSLIMPRFIAFLYHLYRFDCQIVAWCYMETIFLYFIRTLVALQLGVLCVELGLWMLFCLSLPRRLCGNLMFLSVHDYSLTVFGW